MRWTIYKITNLETKKSYIGCTTNISMRISAHRSANPHFFDGGFVVEKLLVTTDKNEASLMERNSVIEHNTKEPSGYNKRDGGLSEYQHEFETKEKMRLKAVCRPSGAKGTKKTPEQVAAMSARAKIQMAENHPMKGRQHSAEAKRRIGEANSKRVHIGCPHSEETKALMSEKKRAWLETNQHPRLGKKMSQESKDKMSATKKARRLLLNS